MSNPSKYRVFCSNPRCGHERLTSVGPVPVRSRQHRMMNYIGSKKVGIVYLVIVKTFDPNAHIERGNYHFYACPVCGREAVFQERWGLLRRID